MAYYEEEFEDIDNVQSVRLVEHNALGTALRVERRFRSSTLCFTYRLPAGRDGLTISADIDWRETHVTLKLDFPTDVNTTKASFDMRRPTPSTIRSAQCRAQAAARCPVPETTYVSAVFVDGKSYLQKNAD